MLSNKEIKFLKSLKQKKYRELEQKYIIEGIHGVEEALKFAFSLVLEIICTEPMAIKIDPDLLGRVTVKITSDTIYSGISNLSTPPGIMVLMKMQSFDFHTFDSTASGVNYLFDGIQDPGNLGTMIRTCDWYGIQSIFLTENTVELYNPKVVQASMGSLHKICCYLINLKSDLTSLSQQQAIWITEMKGEDYTLVEHQNNVTLAIGNESHGVSDELRKVAQKSIAIKSRSNTESLNAAIAQAILCAKFH